MYIQIKATETYVPRPGNPEAKLWASEHHLLILDLAAPTPQTSTVTPTTLVLSKDRKLLNMHHRWISSVHNSSRNLIIGDSKRPDYNISLNKSLGKTNVHHPVRKLLNSPVLGISYLSPMLMTELETLKNISLDESAGREAPRGQKRAGAPPGEQLGALLASARAPSWPCP